MILIFLSASQWNYAYKMMWYRWNLSLVNTPELQRAILASGLVNWQGGSNTSKPTNLGLEHLNGSVKIEMNCYKNSTNNEDIIFGRVCLTNTVVRALRSRFEETFGKEMPGNHTTASAADNMFSLARNLFTGHLSSPRTATDLEGMINVFESADIFAIRVELLEEKVEYFNQRYTKQSILRAGTYSEDLPEATAEATNGIVPPEVPSEVSAGAGEEYITYVDERADGVDDPAVAFSPNFGDNDVPGVD
jgi:hypothetical protein